jgi:hypothetical protein
MPTITSYTTNCDLTRFCCLCQKDRAYSNALANATCSWELAVPLVELDELDDMELIAP